jgi:hypothetical protein
MRHKPSIRLAKGRTHSFEPKDSIVMVDSGGSRAPRNKPAHAGAPENECADNAFDQRLTHHLSKLYEPIADDPEFGPLLRLLALRLG